MNVIDIFHFGDHLIYNTCFENCKKSFDRFHKGTTELWEFSKQVFYTQDICPYDMNKALAPLYNNTYDNCVILDCDTLFLKPFNFFIFKEYDLLFIKGKNAPISGWLFGYKRSILLQEVIKYCLKTFIWKVPNPTFQSQNFYQGLLYYLYNLTYADLENWDLDYILFPVLSDMREFIKFRKQEHTKVFKSFIDDRNSSNTITGDVIWHLSGKFQTKKERYNDYIEDFDNFYKQIP